MFVGVSIFEFGVVDDRLFPLGARFTFYVKTFTGISRMNWQINFKNVIANVKKKFEGKKATTAKAMRIEFDDVCYKGGQKLIHNK